jgi:hypothetical protein
MSSPLKPLSVFLPVSHVDLLANSGQFSFVATSTSNKVGVIKL